MSKNRWIGMMSGTSLDGIDLVCVDFDENENYQIIAAKTYNYSPDYVEILKNAFHFSAEEITELDRSYGKYIGQIINKFKNEFNLKDIVGIASHGQTIFHKPEKSYTLQIGNGLEIAHETGLTVINDFRSQDIVLGGQGAPLVPIGDALLFGDFQACLNLGGFSNISFDFETKRIAFDICAVNFVMNQLAQNEGFGFDEDGLLSRKGHLIPSLLEALENLPFYQQKFPKSLGAEWTIENILPLLEKKYANLDLMRTFTEHVATEISNVFNHYNIQNVLITGGGAKNKFLLERLFDLSPNTQIVLPDENIIDFKEALLFAFLGKRKFENKVNCLASVTGAKYDHSSGVIFSAF